MIAAWIYDEWWQDVEGSSLITLTDLLRTHLAPEHIPLTLIASLDTAPVGTATLLAHDVGTEQWPHLSPWLAALYVVPDYRHRSIGASLVNAIVCREVLGGHSPALTVVIAGIFDEKWLLEIEAIAAA